MPSSDGWIDGPYYLYVGTLQPRKNLATLIAAFASAGEGARSRPRRQLVLAGKVGLAGR